MAKGQKRSNKEQRKQKSAKKDEGPRYLRPPEFVQSSKSTLPRTPAKR